MLEEKIIQVWNTTDQVLVNKKLDQGWRLLDAKVIQSGTNTSQPTSYQVFILGRPEGVSKSTQ